MYPIKTFESGNTVVKVCVEDIKKVIDLVINSTRELDSEARILCGDLYSPKYGGYFIETKGKATCNGDEFSEEIGNEIAFRKVKLYANIKKYKILQRVINYYIKQLAKLQNMASKFSLYIDQDIEAIRKYHPEFNPSI